MARASRRRAVAADDADDGPRIERRPSGWRIRSYAAARQVLQARGATTQAGFTAEFIPTGYLDHHPILISDGHLHDEQRRKVGRFFAPAVVRERYRPHMVACADALVARAVAAGGAPVDELALLYSVEVTGRVVGLTHAPVDRMARRLEAFFRQPPFDIEKPDLGRSRQQWARAAWNALGPLLSSISPTCDPPSAPGDGSGPRTSSATSSTRATPTATSSSSASPTAPRAW